MPVRLLLIILILTGNMVIGQTTIQLTTPTAGTTSPFNTIVGVEAGLNTTGADNVMMGYQSGYGNVSGHSNVFVGWKAGYSNTTGRANVFIGRYAGSANVEGSDNTFVGFNAGILSTGYYNVFVGGGAGYLNSTGSSNSFLGQLAGTLNRSGGDNAFVGTASGYTNETGSYNVFSGVRAGFSNVSGSSNTAIGYQAGYYTTTGISNTFLGALTGTANTSGQGNTLIGYKADVTSFSLTNAAAIGTNAKVAVSNAIVLGDTVQQTKVGIGITAPQFPLDVRGIINIRGNGTLKFSQLANPGYQNGQTDQVLTVDANGETVLARIAALDALVQRLEQLERENKELRQRLEKVERGNQVIAGKE